MTRDDLKKTYNEFVKAMAQRFNDEPRKNFGAMEASGVLVVIARDGTTKARDVRRLVVDEWGGYFSTKGQP